jgi:hypothetical protein
MKDILALKEQALGQLLGQLQSAKLLQQTATERTHCATHMVVMLTWWLSYEYVRNPRHAMEDASAQHGVLHGAQQVLSLMLPYLADTPKAQLLALMQVYADALPA